MKYPSACSCSAVFEPLPNRHIKRLLLTPVSCCSSYFSLRLRIHFKHLEFVRPLRMSCCWSFSVHFLLCSYFLLNFCLVLLFRLGSFQFKRIVWRRLSQFYGLFVILTPFHLVKKGAKLKVWHSLYSWNLIKAPNAFFYTFVYAYPCCMHKLLG